MVVGYSERLAAPIEELGPALLVTAVEVATVEKLVVVSEVKVTGQMVVERATTEVRMDTEPLRGQLVTEAAHESTVTSLVV